MIITGAEGSLPRAWVKLYVDDLAETLAFYRQAFGFVSEHDDGGSSARVVVGKDALHFTDVSAIEELDLPDVEAPLTSIPQGSEVVLAIEITDIEQTYGLATQSGGLPVRSPHDEANGARVAFLRDPNGFLIRLCRPAPSPLSHAP